MNNDEQTLYDEAPCHNSSEQTVLDNKPVCPANETDKKNNKGVRFGVGLASAAAAGAGATILSGSTTIESVEEMDTESIPSQQSASEDVPRWSDGEVPVATGVYEDMTFSEAFAAARSEVGPGGAFEWRGKVYGTYLRDEWNSMSVEERAEYESHFSWSGVASTNESAQDVSTNAATEEGIDEIVANVSEQDDVPVVEVIGTAQDDELDANVAIVSVDDSEVVMLDVDNDQQFDLLLADVNDDGNISEQEVFDIGNDNIAVSDIIGLTGDSQLGGEESGVGPFEMI